MKRDLQKKQQERRESQNMQTQQSATTNEQVNKVQPRNNQSSNVNMISEYCMRCRSNDHSSDNCSKRFDEVHPNKLINNTGNQQQQQRNMNMNMKQGEENNSRGTRAPARVLNH